MSLVNNEKIINSAKSKHLYEQQHCSHVRHNKPTGFLPILFRPNKHNSPLSSPLPCLEITIIMKPFQELFGPDLQEIGSKGTIKVRRSMYYMVFEN